VRFMRWLHKWLGLIVGVQLLLWTVSGLVFAWLDHADVSAEHSTRHDSAGAPGQLPSVVEPQVWLADYASTEPRDIRLIPVLERWVYRVELADRIELRDATDGRPVAIDAALIRQLAQAHYSGGGTLQNVVHERETLEARNAGPVWHAQFDDDERTSLYFSATDAHLVATRNGTWRVFDVFWMLHTMDYRGRDDFNHPLVILFSTGALWLGISGVVLLFRSFRPGELNLVARARARWERP